MAQNPMLLAAAMSALNNGANWQHPAVLPALLALLHQNYDPQGFAAMQAALLQEAQMSQHRQLLAQLQQQQLAAAAAAAMNQPLPDQISIEKAAAAAAMHGNGDSRLVSYICIRQSSQSEFLIEVPKRVHPLPLVSNSNLAK